MSQANPNPTQIDKGARAYILNGGDQAKAWREAYPDSSAKPDSVYQASSRFFKLPQVQSRIKEIQAEQAAKDEKEFDLTAEQIKKMLVNVYRQSTKTKIDNQGNQVVHAPAAAVSALNEINKMNGNHAAKQVDHSSKDGSMSPGNQLDLSKLSTQAIKEIAAQAEQDIDNAE